MKMFPKTMSKTGVMLLALLAMPLLWLDTATAAEDPARFEAIAAWEGTVTVTVRSVAENTTQQQYAESTKTIYNKWTVQEAYILNYKFSTQTDDSYWQGAVSASWSVNNGHDSKVTTTRRDCSQIDKNTTRWQGSGNFDLAQLGLAGLYIYKTENSYGIDTPVV